MLKINMEFYNGVLFVRLKGSLNKLTTDKFISTLTPIINSVGIRYLVYNLGYLSSIDSVGFETLLNVYNEVLKNNGKVLVVNNKFNLEYFKEANDELSALKILKI